MDTVLRKKTYKPKLVEAYSDPIESLRNKATYKARPPNIIIQCLLSENFLNLDIIASFFGV